MGVALFDLIPEKMIAGNTINKQPLVVLVVV